MKRSKFNEAQVAFILRQVDEGATVGEVCRKAGISEATFYVWRKKYAGLMPSEMKRLRQLKDEIARLKRIAPPPKKWTGLCRSALGFGWADVAQG